jgi:hypothetical protein
MLSPLSLFLLSFLILLRSTLARPNDPPTVCIIGSGIGGSSVAHFLRRYSSGPFSIQIFERNGVVGGRMATVNVSGDIFEAGASVLHPKNFYALNYTQSLGLKFKTPSSSSSNSLSLGIWDGKKFAFKTLLVRSDLPFVDKIVSLANSLLMFVRYGFSLLRMETFVEVSLLLLPFLMTFFFFVCLLGNKVKEKLEIPFLQRFKISVIFQYLLKLSPFLSNCYSDNTLLALLCRFWFP